MEEETEVQTDPPAENQDTSASRRQSLRRNNARQIAETEVQTDPPAENQDTPASRSQSSSRSNNARQIAVNFMPSRQLPYNTLRHRRNGSEHNSLLDETDGAGSSRDVGDEADTEESKADNIVKELEQQHQLMDDTPLSEELRREALRDLPQGLTVKRTVRAKLSVSVSLRSKHRPISLLKRTKYRISFAWKRSKERIRDAMFSIELWYEAIRNIEGQFGSAVGSYFRMVRRLFVLDLALSVLLWGFLVIPQSLYDNGVTRRDNGSDSAASLDTEHSKWNIMDWVTGQGRLESSVMFYGHYLAGDIGVGPRYNMPFAYFFTMMSLYFVFFAVLCYRTAESYRRNFIETAGGLSHVFANKVFCGWDFGIVSAHAANLNARSIYNELKELLNEQNKKPSALTFCTRVCHIATNVVVTSLVVASIAAILFGVWKFLEGFSHCEGLVSLLMAACVGLCPAAFHLVGRLEWYSARVSLYASLARTWLLQVALLMLLFFFWSRSGAACWETRFGQETYRLVLLDATVSLIVLPAIEIFRALVYKYRPSGSPPEFNIAYNSLTLIYNQALLWFGMLFSPLLASAVTIKLFFLFYIKRECALRACQPARKVWRAAQTQTVLYMLVTLSLFATIFGIGSVFLRMSSRECGPFVGYPHVFAVLTEGVLRLHERETLGWALRWLYRPGVLGFLILILCVLVYYGRARARAQQAMVELLRHMLALQAKDKDFLLTAISKVSNGEWLYSPKPVDEGPDSHTVRYLRDVRKPSNSSFHFEASRLSRSERPRSGAPGPRPARPHDDGDTDSSFSWQGSGDNIHHS